MSEGRQPRSPLVYGSMFAAHSMEKHSWKKDVAGLSAVTAAGALAAAVLIPSGNVWAAAFGTEGLVVALMFVPGLAWRVTHRED